MSTRRNPRISRKYSVAEANSEECTIFHYLKGGQENSEALEKKDGTENEICEALECAASIFLDISLHFAFLDFDSESSTPNRHFRRVFNTSTVQCIGILDKCFSQVPSYFMSSLNLDFAFLAFVKHLWQINVTFLNLHYCSVLKSCSASKQL